MSPSKPARRRALKMLGALACLPAFTSARAAPPPGASLYQLEASLVDQDGRSLALSSLRGSPVLMSLFYASCDMVCPMIFETIKATVQALPARERTELKVLMVSFDPARDTVAVLKKTADAHGCDAQWTLARTDDATVRRIAAALGAQYRRLSNGEFNHSTTIVLLDRDGRIAARSGKLGTPDPALVQAIHRVGTAAG